MKRGGRHEDWIIGGVPLALDFAHYGSRIILAAADFRSQVAPGSDHNVKVDSAGGRNQQPPATSPKGAQLSRMLLRELAKRYIDAGASILIAPTDTASQQSMPPGDNSPNRITTALRDSISDALIPLHEAHREAGENRVKIIASLGPIDRLLSLNEIGESELIDFYAAQVQAISEIGADAIICRSFTEIESLIVAIRAARTSSNLPVIASMTFDSGYDRAQTILGVTIPQMCKAVADLEIAMVGCDAGEFPDGAPAIVTMLKESCSVPVYMEVNAGRAELQGDAVAFPESPKDSAERIEPLVSAGAMIIGGGLGVTPDHIHEMARTAERLQKRRRDKSGPDS